MSHDIGGGPEKGTRLLVAGIKRLQIYLHVAAAQHGRLGCIPASKVEMNQAGCPVFHCMPTCLDYFGFQKPAADGAFNPPVPVDEKVGPPFSGRRSFLLDDGGKAHILALMEIFGYLDEKVMHRFLRL